MEARLREYRANKRRKELIEKSKENLEKVKNFLTPRIFRDMSKEEILEMEEEEHENVDTEPLIEEILEDSQTEEIVEEPQSWRFIITKWSIFITIWLLLYLWFLKIQFGAVFFVISVIIGICVNTRTRPKRKGEISAYSVFNRNCKSIDGTLKAEELEKQMIYGRLF